MVKKALIGVVCALALTAGYLLVWPVDIEPVAWTPPQAPLLEGVYARNAILADAERISIGGRGAEDVAITADGWIYGGLSDGRIVRMRPDGSNLTQFAHTGGRPLGMDVDARGHLIVADARAGLLSVAPGGRVEVLASEHGGTAITLANAVDIGPDGIIYLTDASTRWGIDHYRADMFEHRPNGRLLAHDPVTATTRLVLDGLYFANGVAVSPDGSFVLVNETDAYRVRRIWLKGDRAGRDDVLIDNLPGFPDGISTGSRGRFWIALFTPRNRVFDALMPRPWLRTVVFRLPTFLQPQPEPFGFVLAIDAAGNVVHNLQDSTANAFSPVTSVREHDGQLYLGSVSYPGIARIAVPSISAPHVRDQSVVAGGESPL